MRPPSPLRAVVFDMDGLLLDTERIAIACWEKAASHLGLAFPPELLTAMVGMHTKKIPDFLREQLGPNYPAQEIAIRCNEFYQSTTLHGVPLKEGVMEILDFLEQHNIPKAVATSSRYVNANRHLEHVDIRHRFEFIVTSEDVVHAKPAPDIYLLATKKLGITPAQAIALEDSDLGIQAALSAGLWSIMIPDQKEPSAAIKALGHPIVHNLHAAQALIAGML